MINIGTQLFCHGGGGNKEIIFTFTALFSYFWGTKKELTGGVFWLFHWELRSWCSSWWGRQDCILLMLISFYATRNVMFFLFFWEKHIIRDILAVAGRCRNGIFSWSYLIIWYLAAVTNKHWNVGNMIEFFCNRIVGVLMSSMCWFLWLDFISTYQ